MIKLMIKIFFAAILSCLLIGCASNPSISSLLPEQRARLNEILVLKGGVERPYTILGTVKGLSCRRNLHMMHNLSEAEAMEGVKIRAVKLGADAVINTACQYNPYIDWRHDCWSSIVCIGDAVTYENE